MARLIEVLQGLQKEQGWLAPDELRRVSEELGVPLYRLEGLVSFYPHLRGEPPDGLEIEVCRDMSCHLSGGPEVQAALERWATESGAAVKVCGVSCLGRCEKPAALSVGHHVHDGLGPEAAIALARSALEGTPGAEGVQPADPVRWRIDPYGDGPRQQAARRLLETGDRDGCLAALTESGLLGMGGAGFPTGRKWEFVRAAAGRPKVVICNADESEPGTFKDRVLLETVPDLVIEGLLLAAFVVEAGEGVIYIREEYARETEALERALASFRERGLLGKDIAGSGFDFDIEIFVSPGGYICGEETALLEALEDKRAEPRDKPPFPASHGLNGRPTLINNVETLAMVPAVLLRGAEWFREQGTNGQSGLKFLALSGHVRRPGVYEVPLGLELERLIEDHGGGVAGSGRLKAFAPGGASSGFLPARLAGTPLAFDTLARLGSMLGSGAIVVAAEPTCMLDLALNALRFFRNESCGKCVPCRVGSEKLVTLLEAIARGEGTPDQLELVDELAETMRLNSICGLGQAAPNPATSLIEHFRDELDAHITERRCPSGVCFRQEGRASGRA